ncbi:hypothetical protein BDF22DRAFT_695990 [Syncephalis plumigaleata]|nr:hypothetical protein BDF22DRAFT_695990 [Syncephalis plumigaleata]
MLRVMLLFCFPPFFAHLPISRLCLMRMHIVTMIRHTRKCTITCTSCNSPMTELFYCNDKWPRSFFIDILLLYSNILAWIFNQSIVIAYPQFIIPYKPTLFLIVTSISIIHWSLSRL